MNDFLGFIKKKWKMIQVRDSFFFTFIWAVSICVTLITVLISAGVTSAADKRAAEKAAEEEVQRQKEEELELLATYTDAEPETSTVTDADAWMLILVNKNHPLPDDFEVPEFTELRNSQKVDSRIYPDLQQMFDDARNEGYSPYITSSYRESSDQEDQLQQKINELLDEGKTQEQAEAEARTYVAEAGTSEHETGLAIDVGSDAGTEAEEALWTWLEENSYKYGFIISQYYFIYIPI